MKLLQKNKKEYYRLSSTCGAPRNHTNCNVQPVDAHVWRQLHLSAVARFSDSYCLYYVHTRRKTKQGYEGMKQKGKEKKEKRHKQQRTCAQGAGRVPRGQGCCFLVRSVLWYDVSSWWTNRHYRTPIYVIRKREIRRQVDIYSKIIIRYTEVSIERNHCQIWNLAWTSIRACPIVLGPVR